MADITISLNNIRNVKTLYVDGIGGFTVRKLGAGEELDLSDRLRRLGAILNELSKIDFSKYDSTKPEDIKKLNKIQKRAEKLTQEVNEIQRFELETYKRCFEDDNNGKNVDLLIDSLSAQDRSELFKQIFDPIKPIEVDKKESVKTKTDAPKKSSNPKRSVVDTNKAKK